MIPGPDHSSRSLAFRRIRSLSEVTDSSYRESDGNHDDGILEPATTINSHRRRRRPPPLLQLTHSLTNDNENQVETSNTDDDLSSPLLHQSTNRNIPSLEYEEQSDSSSLFSTSTRSEHALNAADWKLWVVFGFLVASGVGNAIFAKLQSLPMYNYPTFLNIYANGMYVLMSLVYILPASFFGIFGNSMPRMIPSRLMKPFFIMGGLEALSSVMQVLATFYLPGTLLVLLPQVAIPLSMAAGSVILGEKYTIRQYVGAVVVFFGVLVVVYPIFSHQVEADHYCKAINSETDCLLCREESSEADCLAHNANDENLSFLIDLERNNRNATDGDSDAEDYFCAWVSREEASVRDEDFLVFFWSIVMLLSCVPSVMSAVYKQVALQTATTMDPLLINGWVCLFQFICGLFLVIPAGLVSSPRIHPFEIGSNWMAGMNCLFTQTNSIETGCHPDDCSQAALWVHLSLANSVVYTLSMLFVLKYGSCDLMYLGLTLVVPIGHLAFDFHSSFEDLRIFDMIGLTILVAGLMLYRFGHGTTSHVDTSETPNYDVDSGENQYELIVSDDVEDDVNRLSANRDANNASNSTQDKECFLEFLREPFMLIGDI